MPKSKRLAPFSWRLRPEDRQRLERDAAGMALGAYIFLRVFDPASPPPRRRGQAPVADRQTLSAVLARLGQSRIPNNLNQLAKAAHSGSLVVTPEIEAELREAAAAIADMRAMLVAALGLEDRA